jgi:DNA polymerase-1
MRDTLYIIDVFSLVFQVYHAIPPMTGPNGQPTNAVFGFARDLKMLLEEKQPTHLVCAMDSSGPGVRKEWYPEYKANRSEMPEDLRAQLPLIFDAIDGFHVPRIEMAGWEADDVLATLATQAVAAGLEVRIVTSDKDARQLIGPQTQLHNIRKNTYQDAAFLQKDWGVRPDQVIDFQALVGDSVDNVPGVPLVGPKKAQALLETFGTLEEVLANADKAPGKTLRENLQTFADQALLSRRLVTLRTDLPLEFDLESARVQEPDRKRLLELATTCGFRRLTEELQQGESDSTAASSVERQWETIDTQSRFDEWLDEFRQQSKFCFDLETTRLNAVQAEIVGWAFSWEANVGCYIPVQGPPGQPTLDHETVLEALRPQLENADVEKVNQNIKYDMLVLRRVGVCVQGLGVDPMIGDYLLEAGARGHGLDALAQKYLSHRMISISELIGSGPKQKKMFEVDVVRAAEYAAEDADIAWQLSERIGEELKREKLWDLYWNLERPLISVLTDMEFAGIRVDVDELSRQSGELTGRLEELVVEIHELAGREFNIASPIQLRTILFEELKLPVLKRTKTGPSTSADVLEKLANSHPLPAKIIEHRQLAKLKNTYLDALPEMVNPETGRIHASFNQVVTATGRLSSSDPNLQNIPIRTDEGRLIRRAFIPGDSDGVLVSADYSQIELRMLAHFSGDEALSQAFHAGIDIHTAVAADVFGVAPEDVDSAQRRVAKAVNFGVIYGQSPYGLSAALGIGQDEAAEFIDNYFTRYAQVADYLDSILQECLRTGYATTILGRRREITGIRDQPTQQRTMPERTAINTVIQGSAADLIKKAMIAIQERLHRESHPARMLLQIHDELVFEAPESERDSLIALVRYEMEHALELSVPLVVDVGVGRNWLDVKGD